MRKRLAAPIALAAALLSLAACRTSPEVAAYIGDDRITEQQVTDLQNTTVATLRDGRKTRPISRQMVAETMVLHRLCQNFQKQEGFTAREVDPAEVFEQQVPKDLVPAALESSDPALTEEEKAAARSQAAQQAQQDWTQTMLGSAFLKQRAEALGCINALPLQGEPTDAEYHMLFDKAIAAGIYPEGTTYDKAESELRSDQIVRNLQFYRELNKMIDLGKVSLNPRYAPISIPLLYGQQQQIVLGANVGDVNEVVQER